VEQWLPPTVYGLDAGVASEQIQAPVLVPIVQRIEGEQGVPVRIGAWYSIERLQLLERCLRSRRSALELPFDLRSVVPPLVDVLPTDVFGRGVDRELRAACSTLPVLRTRAVMR
jgi:hypothetical protein